MILVEYSGEDVSNNPQSLDEQAATIWNEVCLNIDKVLTECELHGLAGILMHPKPSVEARLNALTAFNEVCTLIVSALENSADGHGTIRIMINAQQQILLLKLLLNAAKSGDAKDFEKARASLSNQAKI